MGYFENIKVEELFRNEEKYKNPPFSDEELAQTEKAIGWKLPKSYVALLRIRNGGRIDYEKFEDCWLAEIYGITPQDGLIEMFDNWINEWEYPNIGIPNTNMNKIDVFIPSNIPFSPAYTFYISCYMPQEVSEQLQ